MIGLNTPKEETAASAAQGDRRIKMREILFRGKDIYGKWLYGDLINLTNELKQICNHTQLEHAHSVDIKTIGQYTGLLDKNGKRIYEGDIVDFFNIRGKIVNECGAFGIAVSPNIDYDLLESKIPFNNNANFCFNDNFISLWELWWNYEQDDNPLYEVEIIGNIHDNPELLKE